MSECTSQEQEQQRFEEKTKNGQTHEPELKGAGTMRQYEPNFGDIRRGVVAIALPLGSVEAIERLARDCIAFGFGIGQSPSESGEQFGWHEKAEAAKALLMENVNALRAEHERTRNAIGALDRYVFHSDPPRSEVTPDGNFFAVAEVLRVLGDEVTQDSANIARSSLLAEWNDLYPALAQLLNGWTQDGSWSEWDESVRTRVVAFAAKVRGDVTQDTQEGTERNIATVRAESALTLGDAEELGRCYEVADWAGCGQHAPPSAFFREMSDDFLSAIELLTVGADESDGWSTLHLVEAQRLVAKYTGYAQYDVEAHPGVPVDNRESDAVTPAVAAVEALLRKHMGMYDWTKLEATVINDFILTARFGLSEEIAPREAYTALHAAVIAYGETWKAYDAAMCAVMKSGDESDAAFATRQRLRLERETALSLLWTMVAPPERA